MKGFARLISCSLLARILESSFRSVLERVMGRRLDMMVQSWFFFGMRMVCVSSHVVGEICPSAMRLMTLARMGARRSLKCW